MWCFLVHVINPLYLPHLLSLCDHLFWWLLHTLEYFWLETRCSHLSLRHENHKDTSGLPSLSLAIRALVQGRPDVGRWNSWGHIWGVPVHTPGEKHWVWPWSQFISPVLHWLVSALRAGPSSAVTHEVSRVWMSSLFLPRLRVGGKSKCPAPVLARNGPAGWCAPSPRGCLLAGHLVPLVGHRTRIYRIKLGGGGGRGGNLQGHLPS